MELLTAAKCKRALVGSSLFAAAVVLSACNGGTGSVLGGVANNNGYYRVINGSPDAGNIDVAVDGQVQSYNVGTLGYGAVTPYRGFPAGNHTITIYNAGNDTSTGQLYSASVPVNSGQDVSVVLDGEVSPSISGNTLGFAIFNEQQFNTTGTGNAGLNFHNAAPAVSGTTGLNQQVQFGYTLNGGTPVTLPNGPFGVGGQTNPQIAQGIGGSNNLSFFAAWTSGSATTTISTINPTCTTGFPCTAGNLSLYLVDGPGAVAGGTGSVANLVGVFDANGLLTSSVIKK